jgi:hypothetical protein
VILAADAIGLRAVALDLRVRRTLRSARRTPDSEVRRYDVSAPFFWRMASAMGDPNVRTVGMNRPNP